MYAIRNISPPRIEKAHALSGRLHGIWLNIHGSRLHIASNWAHVIDLVREGYAFFEETRPAERARGTWTRFLALSSEAQGYDDLMAELFGDAPWPPHCLLVTAHGRAYAIERAQILVYLTGSLFTAQMEADLFDEYLIVHGASVDLDGQGIVLPGALRCGKSTLTLGLVYRGFRFASDDIVLVHRETLRVHPYPRLINIRQESLYLVPGLYRDYHKLRYSESLGEPRWFLDKSDRAAQPFPVRFVVFPAIADRFELFETSPAQAALLLTAHSFFPQTPTRRCTDSAVNLPTLSRLLADARCYELRHCAPLQRTLDELLARLTPGNTGAAAAQGGRNRMKPYSATAENPNAR